MKSRIGFGVFLLFSYNVASFSPTISFGDLSRHALPKIQTEAQAKRLETPICAKAENLDAKTAKLCQFFCTQPDVEHNDDGVRTEIKYLTTKPLTAEHPTKYFYDLFNESRRKKNPSASFLNSLIEREVAELESLRKNQAETISALERSEKDNMAKAEAQEAQRRALHDLAPGHVPGQNGAWTNGGWTNEQWAQHTKILSQRNRFRRAAQEARDAVAQSKRVVYGINHHQDSLGKNPAPWMKFQENAEPDSYALQTENGYVIFDFEKDNFSSMEPRQIRFRLDPGEKPKLACDSSYDHPIGERKLTRDPPKFDVPTLRSWTLAMPTFYFGGYDKEEIKLTQKNTAESNLKKFKDIEKICDWIKERNPTSSEAIKQLNREYLTSITQGLLARRETLREDLKFGKKDKDKNQFLHSLHSLHSYADQEDQGYVVATGGMWFNGDSKGNPIIPTNFALRSNLNALLFNSSIAFGACLEQLATTSPAIAEFLKQPGSSDDSLRFTIFMNRTLDALAPEPQASAQLTDSQIFEPLSPGFKIPIEYSNAYGGGMGMPTEKVSYDPGQYPGPDGF